MRLEIAYTTTYHYDPPAGHGLTALRLRPRQRAGLSVKRSVLMPREGSIVRSYVDGWGTQVDVVECAVRHAEAQFDLEAIVETGAEAADDAPSAGELVMYGRDSSRVRLLSVAPLAQQLSLDPAAWNSVKVVLCCLPQWFIYRIGATDAQTPMETVLQTGEGVCQDFAHILIGVLRRWGWAARYVSGYVYTGSHDGGRIEAAAMHAWVQVYRPDFGWVGLDPTTGGYADDTYVPVAFGRDYDDVRPVRGVVSGALTSQYQSATLTVTLSGAQQ